MNISSKKRKLASIIDKGVSKFPDSENGNIQLLQNSYEYMDTFKRLMDSCSKEEMNFLCNQLNGLYRFAKLLENMAQGIRDGRISVPKSH